MTRLVEARLPGAPGLAVRVRTTLSGHGVRVSSPLKTLERQKVSGHSGYSGYQNRLAAGNAPRPSPGGYTSPPVPSSPSRGHQKYPDYPDYPDRASNGAGLGC